MTRTIYSNGQELSCYSNTLLIPMCPSPTRYCRTRLKVMPLLIRLKDHSICLVFVETLRNHRIRRMFLENPESSEDMHCIPVMRSSIIAYLPMLVHADEADMEGHLPSIWEPYEKEELSSSSFLNSIMDMC